MPIDDLPDKWRAFGWNCHEIDGHDEESMKNVFKNENKKDNNMPTVVIAHTIKGKGVPFIEGHGKWHHKNPE